MSGETGVNHPSCDKRHSSETLAKMSIAKGTAIFIYDTQETLVNSLSSARKAGLHFDVSKNTIMKYAKIVISSKINEDYLLQRSLQLLLLLLLLLLFLFLLLLLLFFLFLLNLILYTMWTIN